jgi:xanthine dehydrogenase accessory factor
MMARRKKGSIIRLSTDTGQKVTYIIDVLLSMPSLIVFGAGHVGQAVASIAALAGYGVTVVDDREEFVSRMRLPDPRINLTRADFADAVTRLTISQSSAVVIVTRGHQHDEVCLRGVIRSEAGYIGMIGSQRRVISVFERLKNDGVHSSLLERVHAPIGLKIGATSPQEIAVAIMAEVISFFNSESKRERT